MSAMIAALEGRENRWGITKRGIGKVYLLKHRNKIVGWGAAPIVWWPLNGKRLSMIFVDREYRRMGGGAMLAEAIRARYGNVLSMHWNPQAKRFYEKVGLKNCLDERGRCLDERGYN